MSDPHAQPDPEQTLRLPELARQVLEQARASGAGRAAHTLIPGAHAALKQTLLALTEGTILNDHESPGEATIQVLTGSVRLTAGSGEVLLEEGGYAPIPPMRHGLEGLTDAVVLLTVAGPR